MAIIPKLHLLSLVSLAVAGLPGANVGARQASSCSGNDLLGYLCFTLGPSSYATSYCSDYPPRDTSTITSTPTVTVTATTNVATIFDPTTTITVTSLTYENTTLNATDFQTVTTGTQTSYLATDTTTLTTTLTSYTCGGATTTAPARRGLPYRRQGSTTDTLTDTTAVSSCLSSFQVAKGTDGLRGACACQFPDVPTTTTVPVAIPATTTVTVTALTSATSSTQGATTETDEITSQVTVTSTEFVTQSVPPYVSGTTTVTVTSTTVVTSPSPIPSGFRLFTNYTDGSTAYAENMRIGSGYEIIFANDTTTGDPFSVNSTGQLLNDGLFAAVAAEAETYVLPFVYLLSNAAPRPGTFLLSFSVCDGVLRASRAGGGGGGQTYVSALCTVDGNAVLAIGSAASFPSNATCALVTLYLEGGALPAASASSIATSTSSSTAAQSFVLPLVVPTAAGTPTLSAMGTGNWLGRTTPTVMPRHKKLRRIL